MRPSGTIYTAAEATVVAAVVMHSFGWTWPAGIVFGLAISVASTVVLTRVLADAGHLHLPTGHISVGWLVMEDLFTVFVLVLLPAIFGPSAKEASGLMAAVGWAALKILALVAFTFLVGGWAIPSDASSRLKRALSRAVR